MGAINHKIDANKFKRKNISEFGNKKLAVLINADNAKHLYAPSCQRKKLSLVFWANGRSVEYLAEVLWHIYKRIIYSEVWAIERFVLNELKRSLRIGNRIIRKTFGWIFKKLSIELGS